MKNLIVLILVLGFVSLAYRVLPLEYQTIQYEANTEMPGFVAGSMTTKYFAKADKVRIETSVLGQQVFVIFNGSKVYSYTPAQKTAFELPFSGLTQNTPVPDFKNNPQFEYKGEESFEGTLCDVYQNSSSGAESKIWVDKTIDFPVRLQMNTPQGRIITRIQNIKKDEPLEDSLFELPQDAVVMQIPGEELWDSRVVEEKLEELKESDYQLDGVTELLEGALSMEDQKKAATEADVSIDVQELNRRLQDMEKIIKDFGEGVNDH